MQIHRLTETVFALLKNERMTAKELAERFEVSARTVYRDIELLSASGIPVITDKGNGGGISIAEQFRLSNSMLTEEEKAELIAIVTAYSATTESRVAMKMLDKLSGSFRTEADYIEVDFTDWRNDSRIQKNFEYLKACIIQKKVVKVTYRNSSSGETVREAEPLKLLYKDKAWYLYAYCRLREENRLFKLSRIFTILETGEYFQRICSEKNIAQKIHWSSDTVTVEMKIDKKFFVCMREEFNAEKVTEEENYFMITEKMPKEDWLIHYILSYGDSIEIVKPLWLKEKVREIHRSAAEKV